MQDTGAAATCIRVVLVDDHEMVAESFERVLATTGDIEVVAVAGTAAAAVAAAKEHIPDVIVMDYLLPDDLGAVAATRIRSEHPQIKIVMLSGTDDPRALASALNAGCVGYFQKTRALRELPAAIRAAAAGGAVISPQDLERLGAQPQALGTSTASLTRREREVLVLVAEGLPNQAIAERLFLSLNTVRTHVQTILHKMGAHSKLEAVRVAEKHGLLDHLG